MAPGFCLVHRSTFLSRRLARASEYQFVPSETLIKTHVASIMSSLASVSGLKLAKRPVIGVVNRFPHERPMLDLIRDSKAQKDEIAPAYLCLQQVRRPKNPRFHMALPLTGHLWTGRGLQVKPSRQWFLKKEGRCDNLGCAANKNHNFLNLEN